MSKLKVYAPYDQSLIEEIPLKSADEMNSTIEKAEGLFLDRKKWLPKHQRIEIVALRVF